MKKPTWLLALYFIIGFLIIHTFRTLEYPYWLGVIVTLTLIMLASTIWNRYSNSFVKTDALRPTAGIESVKLNKKIYFYAYDFSNDEVVSPIFDSEQTMVEYAEKNLSQRDGNKPQEYWQELSGYAKEDSQIFGEVPSLRHTEIKALWTTLRSAKEENKAQPLKELNPFISDIILQLERDHIDVSGSKNIDPDIEITELSNYDITEIISYITGHDSEINKISYRDCATYALIYLDSILEKTDDSWHAILSK